MLIGLSKRQLYCSWTGKIINLRLYSKSLIRQADVVLYFPLTIIIYLRRSVHCFLKRLLRHIPLIILFIPLLLPTTSVAFPVSSFEPASSCCPCSVYSQHPPSPPLRRPCGYYRPKRFILRYGELEERGDGALAGVGRSSPSVQRPNH